MEFFTSAVGLAVAGEEGGEYQEGGRGGRTEKVGSQGWKFEGEGKGCLVFMATSTVN